jgi:CubicO group peptidase (beta-lactamase class C family)
MAQGDINTAFQAAIDAGKINGAVIFATDAEGKFVYEQAIGERTLLSGEKRPEQVHDVLYLASATKLITTIVALQCVEDGLLTLKGDLSHVAPELAAKQVITGFSEDGKTPLLEPATAPITLELLLTHSSGLVFHFLNPLIAKWREWSRGPNDTRKRNVEELFDYPLAFQPGTSWMYSPGIDWAGRIVERATGKTLGDYMDKRIFAPLDINSAQFFPVTREDLRARMVDLNPSDPEGLGGAVIGGHGEINKTIKGHHGGSSLFMAGNDYIKIIHSLLANDGKLLKPSTVDDMFEQHLSPEASAGHAAAMAGPGGVFFRVGVEPGSKAGYGLGGLVTLEDVEGWYGDHTLSWGGGMTFSWFIDRKNNLCGVGAIQSKPTLDNELVENLKQTFRHDIYRKRAAWKESTV